MKNLFDFVFAFNLGSMPPNAKSNVNKHSMREREGERVESDEKYKSIIIKSTESQSNSFGSNIEKNTFKTRECLFINRSKHRLD